MFTGIVEEAGEIVAVDDTEGGAQSAPDRSSGERSDPRDEGGRRLRVAGSFAGDLSHGQSISVSGACLTVEAFDEETFELFLSEETLERTYLDQIAEGDVVNLERAMRADDRFDGHIVQGHVDATGEVTQVDSVGEDWTFGFSIPDGMGKYIVEKGSVAVDGISLTVADRREDDFTTAIIPASYELTNLSEKAVGDPVHIEVDVVAKYVENLTEGYLR